MKLRLTLGVVAVFLMVGIFYTFAFAVADVEDVEDDPFATGYYIPDEKTAEDQSLIDEDEIEVIEPAETEVVSVTTAEVAEEYDDDWLDNTTEHIEAVPAMISMTEVSEKNRETETERTVNTEPPEEEYPEDDEPETYPVTEEDEDDDVPEDDDVDDPEVTTVTETEYSETEQTTVDNGYSDDADIVVTLFWEDDKNDQDETTVTVGQVDDTSTSETFTAKFNGSTQTVNAYDLVCWIVNNEISESFNDEAIKAQAVAAYSYVKYHNVNGLTPSVLVKKNPSNHIKSLVSEVWGVCCYYNGSVAQTVYMASSSGYTADAEHVWGGSVPYLKSVSCPFDADYDPNYGVVTRVSESRMRSMLESCLGISLSANPYNWMRILSYVDGNYVYEVDIDGQATISGRKMREGVFGYNLKSAAFDVHFDGEDFVFTTYGYGHGVGMSQNGANILAKQGYSYTQILKYYFTGIEVL
ncbi:MAG: SpoIID/LytB domain-containing protein [Oscillospiraceae bacterium]|nr:SpoIID/LytB domain-containing protein [Oscillospiraceae bacterium]